MSVLADLPENWCYSNLEELARSVGGGTPSKSDPTFWTGGTIPWVSPKDMKTFNITSSEDTLADKALDRLSLIPTESVLIVVRSGILSRTLPVALSKLPVTINQDMRAFVPEGGISARYLAWLLVAKENEILSKCSKDGTTVASIEGSALARFPLAIAPAAEQTRIVTKLEELLSDLDAGVAELKAAQKKLARYRQSLLKAAVAGALTAEWRRQRQFPPLPNPSPAGGEGLTSAPRAEAGDAAAPLPPRGGGAGGEGAQPAQVTTPTQQRHARALRHEQTPQEHALWQHLRAKRFSGFKFRRQQPLGRYIVDFVCFEKRLIVELDGGQHAEQQDYDAVRDAWLQAQGFRVLRYWNNAWHTEKEAVLDAIWHALCDESPLLHHLQPPLPNPSPARGEGLTSPARAEADGINVPFFLHAEATTTGIDAPLPPRGGGAGGEGGKLSGEGAADGAETETGAQLLARLLAERRARWEARQLARFHEQGKPPPRDWQKKYPEPVQPETTGLPELPEGWVWASVDQLSPDDLANGRSVPSADNGAKVLRLTAVRNGRIDLSAYKYGAWTEEEAKPFAVVENDLLIVRGNGSLSLVGRAALVPVVHEQIAYPDTLIRLRVVDSVVRPAWLGLMWDSETTRTHIERRARTSAGIYKISQPDITSVAIPLPPRAEQDAILALFAATDKCIVEMESMTDISLKQSTAQRQNLLRAAFSGQLVPQDPDDEPASVLLERLRAERAARDAVKKPRGRKHREAA